MNTVHLVADGVTVTVVSEKPIPPAGWLVVAEIAALVPRLAGDTPGGQGGRTEG